MNSTSLINQSIFVKNLPIAMIESWFIPIDIMMIVCTILVIILSTLFLFIIIVDKTCHTIPMMLIANSCLTALVSGCCLLSLCAFTFKNDLEKIEYQDSLCIIRGYLIYSSYAVLNYSFLLQSLYRYITVIYPNRLFCQSFKFQSLLICLTWIFALIYPIAFIFNDEFIYDVDNQICLLILRFSFFVIYGSLCIYTIPMLMIMFIYFKLVRYVHAMGKRVTPVNILYRVQRELKMVRRTIILVSVLVILGFPFSIFIIISFFTIPPKYHFRIAFLFIDVSMTLMMIALFQFTDPLKASIMKRINVRPNIIAATIT